MIQIRRYGECLKSGLEIFCKQRNTRRLVTEATSLKLWISCNGGKTSVFVEIIVGVEN